MINKTTGNRLFKMSVLSLAVTGWAAHAAVDCTNIAEWQSGVAYTGGQQVQKTNIAYEAKWWTQADPETHSGDYQEWKKLGNCGSGQANEAPLAEVLSPMSGSSFTEGDSVVIEAQASDSDGSVTKVEVLVDGVAIATVTTAPYSATWTAVKGSHQITVRATDDKGAETTSAANVVTVAEMIPDNYAPTATLTSDAVSNTLNVNDSVVLTLSGADQDGTVASLELFQDGVSVAQVAGASGSYTYAATAVGNTQFSLVATDDKGAQSSAAALSFRVVDNTAGPGDRDACKPEGLYQTPGVNTPYCSIYDADGREDMGADHPRRVIGYFTSWRNGANGQPTYLVDDIPWDKITHINYAFAHVDANNKVSIGDPNAAGNAATNMEWPGVAGAEMDPSLPYKGHFNLLNKYKKLHPDVKTLISVGGWAETGGYFDASGNRVASGGFYTMTTNADGSVNTAGINAFAKSAVEFIQTYGFDGVDIDYEYPSSMNDSGHPDDFPISNARRAGLNASYQVLMKTLREELDKAGEIAGTHYMLTIASPSSSTLR